MYKKSTLTLKITPNTKPLVAKGHKFKRGDTLFETAGFELDEFDLAKILSVSPRQVLTYLTVKPHTEVKTGQVIARKKNLISREEVKSPVGGEFVLVDEKDGKVGIKRATESKKFTAWFSGTVDLIDDTKMQITVSGKEFIGREGRGKPTTGKLKVLGETTALTMPIELENTIIIVKKAFSDLIAKADALGAVAIVAESIDPPPFSLPYLLFSDITAINRYHDKWVIIHGDEKQLLIVNEHGEH